MSITEELREYAHDCCAMVDDAIHDIADRIDAEHEKVEQDLIDANNQMEQLCECSIKLPVDADGEVIHIGDVMEWCDSGETLEVVGIGDDCLYYLDGEEAEWTAARNKRHHHAPTVEDVLREFTDAVLEWAGKSGTVAEVGTWSDVAADFTAKLQLREDA